MLLEHARRVKTAKFYVGSMGIEKAGSMSLARLNAYAAGAVKNAVKALAASATFVSTCRPVAKKVISSMSFYRPPPMAMPGTGINSLIC